MTGGIALHNKKEGVVAIESLKPQPVSEMQLVEQTNKLFEILGLKYHGFILGSGCIPTLGQLIADVGKGDPKQEYSPYCCTLKAGLETYLQNKITNTSDQAASSRIVNMNSVELGFLVYDLTAKYNRIRMSQVQPVGYQGSYDLTHIREGYVLPLGRPSPLMKQHAEDMQPKLANSWEALNLYDLLRIGVGALVAGTRDIVAAGDPSIGIVTAENARRLERDPARTLMWLIGAWNYNIITQGNTVKNESGQQELVNEPWLYQQIRQIVDGKPSYLAIAQAMHLTDPNLITYYAPTHLNLSLMRESMHDKGIIHNGKQGH